MEQPVKSRSVIRHVGRPQSVLPRVFSNDLLRGGRRLIIDHAGEAYCLRLTRNEKLILTKN